MTEKKVSQSAVDVGGVVSGGGADAEHFLKAAADGFPWQASLEADLSKVQKTPVGRSVQVNGQTIAGPVYVARHSRIYGVAFLGRADESTTWYCRQALTNFQRKTTWIILNGWQRWGWRNRPYRRSSLVESEVRRRRPTN